MDRIGTYFVDQSVSLEVTKGMCIFIHVRMQNVLHSVLQSAVWVFKTAYISEIEMKRSYWVDVHVSMSRCTCKYMKMSS